MDWELVFEEFKSFCRLVGGKLNRNEDVLECLLPPEQNLKVSAECFGVGDIAEITIFDNGIPVFKLKPPKDITVFINDFTGAPSEDMIKTIFGRRSSYYASFPRARRVTLSRSGDALYLEFR